MRIVFKDVDDIDLQFKNNSCKQVSDVCGKLLGKGPNYRILPTLDNKFVDSIDLALNNLTYKLSWNQVSHSGKNKKLVIPDVRS